LIIPTLILHEGLHLHPHGIELAFAAALTFVGIAGGIWWARNRR
jgi:hypothetical protein